MRRSTYSPPLLAASLASALALMTGACSPSWFVEDADREVTQVLAEADGKALADRESWIRQPEPRSEDGAEQDAAALDGEAPDRVPLIELNLENSLGAGFTTSREYLTRQEDLYVAGLGLTLTRFNFGPQLNSTVGYLWGDSELGPSSSTADANFSLSQILKTGGTFSVATGLSTNRTAGPHGSDPDKGRAWSSNVDFALDQPLLRGAGYDVAWESLTQAERDILYSVRNFEVFRQDHAIGIIAEYFGLISQKTQLENTRVAYDNAVYDREKSSALRLVDRIPDSSLIQAKRREVTSRNDLLVAQTDYQFSLDTFRVRLGLPEADEITIGDEVPPFEAVRLDADSAVEVALFNRLDLITAEERVEDSERQLGIARNNLQPDLDLDLGYGRDGNDGYFGGAVAPNDWSANASLRMEIPLQRLPERNTYRSRLIAYDQAQRNYDLLLANTERDIRDALRNLDQLEEQIALAEQQISQDERAVALTQIQYEAGEIDVRELLDSRQSLVDSQNALIQVQVNHFIARLRLYRDLGLLFIDENGNWRA